jgi:hypothetical protein
VADVVEDADVRMLQPRDDFRLGLELLPACRFRDPVFGQDLNGDSAVDPAVTRGVVLARATGASGRLDLVRPELSANRQRHGRKG